MPSVGYAVLPVLPSFDGISREIESKIAKPLAKASKTAGESIEKGLGSSVDKAAKDVEKAQYRVLKSTQELEQAESKLSEQKLKSEAANKQVEIAARKRAEAEEKGLDAVERAEADLLKKRAAAERESRNLAKAEGDVEKALSESARASQSLADRQKQLEKANDGAADSAGEVSASFEQMTNEAEGVGLAFDGITGKVAGLATAFAGISGAGAFLAEGMAVTGEIDKLNDQLGLAGDAAEATGEAVKDLMGTGVAASAEEAANAVGALAGTFKDLSTGEITDIADNFQAMATTFDYEVSELAANAGIMVKHGLANDVEEAADLMVSALQRATPQIRDEVMDATHEYSVFFSNMGYNGAEAMALLVDASEGGQYAVDKVGDAVKEFSVLAIDPAKADVFEALGINAEEAATAVAEGGAGARETIEKTARALLDLEDPGARAAAAVELFGAPIEDLGVDQMPAFLESLAGGSDAMEGFVGASQELADAVGGTLEGRLNALKGTVSGLAADAFMELWDTVSENKELVLGLASALGGLVGTFALARGAMMAFTAAQGAMTVATTIANGGFKALNATMKANIFIAIASAVAALVAGLVYFFTQTETGQEIWASFTEKLASGWEWVVEKLTSGVDWIREKWAAFSSAVSEFWASYIKPVFDAFAQVAQVVLGVTFATVVGTALAAWNLLSSGIKLAWEGIIQPVWSAISGFVTGVLWPALQAGFGLIRSAWDRLANAIQWAWQNIILVAWDALKVALQALWSSFVQPIFGFIQAAWNVLSTAIMNGWTGIIKPAWDAFAAALHVLWSAVVSPILTWAGDKWQWFADKIGAVISWVNDVAFSRLRSALDSLKSFFESIVNGIRNVWNRLRRYLAKPINFMIGTVYNEGILRAWNVIAGILPGLKEGSPLAGIPEHATGGRIVGPGTGTSDDVLMWGSAGEHMLTYSDVQKIGGHGAVYAMREAVQKGRAFTYDGEDLAILPKRVRNDIGDLAGAAPGLMLPAFAKGGEIRPMWEAQLMAAHKFAQAQHGKPYQWAGPTGPGSSFDCSGFMGSIAAVIQNMNPWQRYWATMSFPSPGAQGFAPGLGPGFSIGIFNGGPYGGHTAGTLGPAGPFGSVNVESGGSPSMVKYGPGAVGADHRQFTMQYHLPIGADGAFVSGGGGGVSPESMKEAISKKLGGAVDKIMNPIVSLLPQKPPEWKGIPRGMYDRGRDGLVDKIAEGVAGLSDRLGSVFAAVSGMGDLVRDSATGAWSWLQANLFDTGGVWKPGTLGLNLSGKNEYVFTNDSMRSFESATRMIAEAAKEIRVAFRGGDWGYSALAAVLRNEEWARAIVNGAADLGKIANPTSYEGIAARAGLGKASEIAGALGFDGTKTLISGVLGAERELLDARASHAKRLAAVAEAEKGREDALAALAKAESEEYEDEEKRREAISKATDDVTKAEEALLSARRDSAQGLDMSVFEVAPQIFHGLTGAAAGVSGLAAQASAMGGAAAQAVPMLGQVAGALSGVASMAGPAGISVGVAIQGVLTAVNLVKTVFGVISDFVSGIFGAIGDVFALQAKALKAQNDWAKTVDEMRSSVIELRVSWVEAQIALRDATWKTRLAQSDVVRAQLEGVKTVAEAEAKLEAERRRVARASWDHFSDMSLAYDRYRWLEYRGMADRLDMAAAVTPEILALEAEVNAAKLKALANQRQASMDALTASWEQRKAAMTLMKVQSDLAWQTQQLALMQSKFGGFGQAESLQAMNTAKLHEERSKVQSQIGKSFWRLSYWLTGAGVADARRIKELDRIIAEREAAGKGAGDPNAATGFMSFFGYSDSAMNAVRNGGFGAAEQAMADFQEQKQLQQIELERRQLEQQIEQNKLFVDYQKQIGALQAEIEALRAGGAAHQYSADAYREKNPAVRAALVALAEFEAGRAAQYSDVAAGRRQVVEITIPDQDIYSREQVDALLKAVQKVQSIDARVRVLETPENPGANRVLQDITRRY
ncbi:hypothetical protein [Corynebacterium cystitidis]|uniref:hypothetical protein n=1 Tax=Corynebacterium cystitidis TaxID=35757 RepID=UPI00211E067F|nr:hypothetical protein [Corynebacterium cystitidis]